MVLPQLPSPNSSGGYDLDQLIQIVSQLEAVGLLNEFLRDYPQYLIGVEVARVIIQRGQANNNANVRGLGSPTAPVSQAVALAPPVYNPALPPSAPSVRYFVTLLSQLLEEQCPNRADPNVIQCEDRCLAALQMAVVECLKIVRQRRLAAGPQAIMGIPQQIRSQQGPYHQQIGFPQQMSAPQQFGFPQQMAAPQQFGYQQQMSTPQQFGFPQGGCGFPRPGMGFAGNRQNYQPLPPPPSTNITGPPTMVGGHLAQRLASIPQPSQCPGIGEYRNVPQQVQPVQYAPLVGTLEERLAAIPVPPPCPLPAEIADNRGYNACCGISKSQNSREEGISENFYNPVAGEWSDGIGGFKINSSHGSSSKKQAGNLDGVGGSKVKGVEEE